MPKTAGKIRAIIADQTKPPTASEKSNSGTGINIIWPRGSAFTLPQLDAKFNRSSIWLQELGAPLGSYASWAVGDV